MSLTGYRPKRKDQLTGSPLGPDNCNMSAAAVYADDQTLGAIDKTADQMRVLSGDTSGGTTMAGAATALARVGLHLDIVHDGSIGALNESLRHGGAIVHGDYDQVPVSLRGDEEFLGLHSVFALGATDTDVVVYDGLDDGRHDQPTGHVAPVAPILWPRTVFDRYAEKFPNGLTYGLIEPRTVIVMVALANVRSGPHLTASVLERVRLHQAITYGTIVVGDAINHDARWFRVFLPRLQRIGFIHASVVRRTV